MKNFKIGKELKTILTSDEELTSYVENKIFPIVANAGTTFPFIVYRRSGYRPQSNKDYEDEIVSIDIAVLSDKYEESVDVANATADALLGKETDIINDIRISNINEDFAEDTYIQNIGIDIYIK